MNNSKAKYWEKYGFSNFCYLHYCTTKNLYSNFTSGFYCDTFLHIMHLVQFVKMGAGLLRIKSQFVSACTIRTIKSCIMVYATKSCQNYSFINKQRNSILPCYWYYINLYHHSISLIPLIALLVETDLLLFLRKLLLVFAWIINVIPLLLMSMTSSKLFVVVVVVSLFALFWNEKY